MIKKHLLLLWFEIRSAIKILPRFLIILAVVGCLLFGLAFLGNRTLNSQKDTYVNMKIAAVMPKGDPMVAIGFDMVSKMESVAEICQLIPMSRDDAYDALRGGDVAAAVIIPDDFVNDLMYGINTPAEVVIPNNPGLESLLFCTLIDAGALTLSHCEAGIYSVIELFTNHNRHDAAALAEEALYNRYVIYALNRSTFFKFKPVSASGNVSTGIFYACSAIVVGMLLCGIVFCDSFLSSKPRLSGVSNFYAEFCEYLAVSLVLIVILGIGIFVSGLVPFSLINLGMLALLILSIVGFIKTICSLFSNTFSCTVVIFIAVALMAYVCGRIVPISFIPQRLGQIGEYLPMTAWCRLLENMTASYFDINTLWFILIFAAICLCLCVLSAQVKRRLRNG